MTISQLTHLQKFFTARDYTTPEIPLLQPADPFLETAGEDMRRRIFITGDRAGRSLCLRPEFTIPVCLAHLAGGEGQGRYAYGGVVFRQRSDGPAEFLQAGVETIGGKSDVESDVECLTTALEALAHCGLKNMHVVFGDQAIFAALLSALELPDAWHERLLRGFGDHQRLESDLRLMGSANQKNDRIDATLQRALGEDDRAGVARWIGDKMAQGNLPGSGGRTAVDIAHRMLSKAQLAASQLSDAQRKTLTAFLAIEVPLEKAVDTLQEFSRTAEIDMGEAIEVFGRRAKILAGKYDITWRAGFGRQLDYYTGMVFEISQSDAEKPVCGGGRYDGLMGMLGAETAMPAVGFSIWLDRLEEAT